MGEYQSTISPYVGLEIAEPTLQGATEPSVARFAYTDTEPGIRPTGHSVHLGRRDALNAAADLLELAGEYALAEPVRKEAAVEPLVDLHRGDFVRWVKPDVRHSKYAGSIVVIMSLHSTGRDTVTGIVPARGNAGSILLERTELSNPLNYDDDGEKLIVG